MGNGVAYEQESEKTGPDRQIRRCTDASAPRAFGYEEMLTELEAIVSDAEVRLAEEDEIA